MPESSPVSREQALSVLMAQRTRLIGSAWSILRDAHMAEDVYQELVIKVFDRLDTFEGPKHLHDWCWKVMRNRCYEIMRQQKYRKALLEESVLSLLDQDMETRESDMLDDKKDALRHCIGKLTDNARIILKLRYFEGMQAKEVAELLDRQPNAVYKSLQRIYENLRNCMLSAAPESLGGLALEMEGEGHDDE